MVQNLLTINQLSKIYGQQKALDNINFTVGKGEIIGLVGENGAGKTTLMRILSGLIEETSGQLIWGKSVKLGAIIESPTLYPNMTAYDNLNYLALQLGLGNREQVILDTLDLVGLDNNPKKKVKDYSLGMRQRLGIAFAILDRPEFLILDEPINGLDPVGIKEMRHIITRLRDEFQMTVLISSHILSELEMLVDRYLIMHKGRIIQEGQREDLQTVSDRQIFLATSDQSKMAELLTQQGLDYQEKDSYLVLDAQQIANRDLVKLVVSVGLELDEIFYQQVKFEDYYLNLITDGGN